MLSHIIDDISDFGPNWCNFKCIYQKLATPPPSPLFPNPMSWKLFSWISIVLCFVVRTSALEKYCLADLFIFAYLYHIVMVFTHWNTNRWKLNTFIGLHSQKKEEKIVHSNGLAAAQIHLPIAMTVIYWFFGKLLWCKCWEIEIVSINLYIYIYYVQRCSVCAFNAPEIRLFQYTRIVSSAERN